MQKITALSCFLPIALLLGGCATPATSFSSKELTRTDEEKTLKLTADYQYVGKFYQSTITYDLKSGTYKAEYVDRKGIYYRGPEKCFEQHWVTGPANPPVLEQFINDCGLLISNEKDRPVRIYLHVNKPKPELSTTPQTVQVQFMTPPTNTQVVGGAIGAAVVNAIILSGANEDMQIMDNQPTNNDLRNLIILNN